MKERQLFLFDLPEMEPNSQTFKPIKHPLWTEHKAKLIERYLYYFVLITKHGVYIDGFAGPQEPNKPETWSAKLVLESEPRWLRSFFLCDLDPVQVAALERLRSQQPTIPQRTIEVIGRDFNQCISTILESDRIDERTATFCLVDQRTFQCNWETVRSLAARKIERKIELFYFVPTGWLDRSISGLGNYSLVEQWWGRDDWQVLRNATGQKKVELFCQRFTEELGYRWAHAWPIYDAFGSQRTMYHMIHATDHPDAPNLMSRAYRRVLRRKEPLEQLELEFDAWARSRGVTPERQADDGGSDL